ncbi:hypothetical protein BN2475_420032 [Paraburkholderia ribeironis]|uniref:Transposase n=1 Tax=Paraburkholderia ribeironis TaxID=1247936 RepID=A0A1N7S7H1_9BURK|nr:hypothetical protein BN2475_420032 [Paraburkholderia ribeironis]
MENLLCCARAAALRLAQNLDGFHLLTRLIDSHKAARYFGSSRPNIRGAAPTFSLPQPLR